jgi:hypothetical protein
MSFHKVAISTALVVLFFYFLPTLTQDVARVGILKHTYFVTTCNLSGFAINGTNGGDSIAELFYAIWSDKIKNRDPRLGAFAAALQEDESQHYLETLRYLSRAQASVRLQMAAHPYYWKKDYACFLFLSELGNLVNGEIPIENGLALSLLSDKVSASQVADAYRRLLLYSPNNLVFQRILQKALEAGNLNK